MVLFLHEQSDPSFSTSLSSRTYAAILVSAGLLCCRGPYLNGRILTQCVGLCSASNACVGWSEEQHRFFFANVNPSSKPAISSFSSFKWWCNNSMSRRHQRRLSAVRLAHRASHSLLSQLSKLRSRGVFSKASFRSSVCILVYTYIFYC